MTEQRDDYVNIIHALYFRLFNWRFDDGYGMILIRTNAATNRFFAKPKPEAVLPDHKMFRYIQGGPGVTVKNFYATEFLDGDWDAIHPMKDHLLRLEEVYESRTPWKRINKPYAQYLLREIGCGLYERPKATAEVGPLVRQIL